MSTTHTLPEIKRTDAFLFADNAQGHNEFSLGLQSGCRCNDCPYDPQKNLGYYAKIAAEIQRRCNSHAALVEALALAHDLLMEIAKKTSVYPSMGNVTFIEETLALAKEADRE